MEIFSWPPRCVHNALAIGRAGLLVTMTRVRESAAPGQGECVVGLRGSAWATDSVWDPETHWPGASHDLDQAAGGRCYTPQPRPAARSRRKSPAPL